ncbi:hypothetical protein [Deinococcus budaensis]|uniref:Uncharacterized protein n=1 Tax=Deinococcus budaensis TaxID=1665626 RepID=A0A7W8LRM5_9DEIO|nr:hypothetical protein [Deinococcus budaensis]MBB5235969.1 hypothetical protein [Deinococcus budaensis]
MSPQRTDDLDEATQAAHSQANLETIAWLRAALAAEDEVTRQDEPSPERSPDEPS